MRKSFARLQAFNEHMIQQGISCFLFKPADVNQYTPNELNEQHFPIGADAVKENQTKLSLWSSNLCTVCLWLFLSGVMKGKAGRDKMGPLTIFRSNTALQIQ